MKRFFTADLVGLYLAVLIVVPFHLFALAFSRSKESGSLVSVQTGALVEDLELTDLNGDTAKLHEILDRKKVTLIQFWATWCATCRAELKHLSAINGKVAKDDLQIIAVSIDLDHLKVAPFLEREEIVLKSYIDVGQKISNAIRLRGVPVALVVGRDRKVIEVIEGRSLGYRSKVKDWLEKLRRREAENEG